MSNFNRVGQHWRSVMLALILVFLSSLSLTATGNVAAEHEDNERGRPKGVNILLVHGAFADASSWSKVSEQLIRDGYNVLAVQLPLSSLTDDVAITKQALASLTGPTIIAAHSYGGAVMSGAAVGATNVVGLVYIAAFAPDEGESLIDLVNRYPITEGLQHIVPSYREGYAWIDPAYFPKDFVADIRPVEAQVLAVAQKPASGGNFAEKAGPAAWKNLPSWFLVSRLDKTINPDLERFEAARMHATTVELNSSHASPVSHPEAVVALIERAAQATTRN